ncbi:hypothetical protein [Paracoccus sp. (in: a-proteobacteria)]|uniref:hypothetical protein n=1 Tax=Paracoccus sp. TaxID=267 RepID=UPI0026DF33D7|nr:hypothetical protein [Paracoccus sp. (in: a-proteobacteria)]MDO5648117.1 hypothetical protein [Paracoccus sp. (in: a-proteobacteria)]
MPDDAQDITDYTAGLFLRYFRSGLLAPTSTPSIDVRRDIDLLRSHWAVSAPVRSFAQYVLRHPHEAQSLLSFRERVDDTIARGRIDARATAMLRVRSGLPSVVVAHEPVRSFDTGPNQLVAWVVHNASLHAGRLLDEQPAESGYRSLVEAAMAELAAIKRLDALREPLKSASAARRPGPGATRDAARSRKAMYRHAVAAYRVLSDMESGYESAICEIIQSTLIAPAEIWRRFELAVAVGVGLALSEATDIPMKMRILSGGGSVPILTCGPYAIYWQQVTTHYTQPAPEPSEQKISQALAAYGKYSSTERPDLILVDRDKDKVMAVIEVKHQGGDTADTRFREAMSQIIRYARGYASGGDMDDLIRRSLIAVNTGVPELLDDSAPTPLAVDFASMRSGGLGAWVRQRLLA